MKNILIIMLFSLLFILGIWFIINYNKIIKNRMKVKESISQIDVQLKRRNDLIPNLVETIKGYSKYESKTLENIVNLRTSLFSISNNSLNNKMKISDDISKQISNIFAIAENYPDLKANNNFEKLQEELINTENKISYSRQLYNSVVSNYNVSLETFPTNIIARMFNFKAYDFIIIDESEKNIPNINFEF